MKSKISEIRLMKRLYAAVNRSPLPSQQVPPVVTDHSWDTPCLTAGLQGVFSEPKGYWLYAHCEKWALSGMIYLKTKHYPGLSFRHRRPFTRYHISGADGSQRGSVRSALSLRPGSPAGLGAASERRAGHAAPGTGTDLHGRTCKSPHCHQLSHGCGERGHATRA